jgi:LacI family transcriptional regulator
MHLIENGYNHIGFVTLNSDQIQMNDRLRGYNEALLKNGLQGPVLKVNYNSDSITITENVSGFIKENPQLDAILFATNYLAVNGLVAIKNLGLNIPGDIAIVGFDDNTHFALFSPSITAVAQPVDQIASEVVSQLLLALHDEDHQYVNKTIELETELIIRESSLPNQKNEKLIKNYKGPPALPLNRKQSTEKSTIKKQSKNAV